MNGTLAAVSVCAMMQELAVFRGCGEVAEWFKAAVLKTASREHRQPAHFLGTRQNPSRNGRVLHPFAQNMAEHMSAQSYAGPVSRNDLSGVEL